MPAAPASTAHTALRAFTERYTTLSTDEWNQVSSHWRPAFAKTGDYLLREGQACNSIWFLHKGLLRFSYTDDEGEEHTKYFTDPPYVLTSMRSLESRQPAIEAIHVIAEAELLVIDKVANDGLLGVPAWSQFVRQLVQEVQFFTEEILLDAQRLSAEQRYLKLLDEQPALLMRVPLKHLASYLGMTPQSLSRIRARVRR